MKRVVVLLLVVGIILGASVFGAREAAAEKTKILWWSHWANEPSKRTVIETIVTDYMKANPEVEIELVWWDKNPLQDAWRTAMTAGGDGAPDIITDPADQALEQIKAGWFLDLGEEFPWDNYMPEAKENAKYGDMPGYYKCNIGLSLNMIFYNKEIFDEVGVTVPEDYTFTQEEFVEVVKKVSDAGYAGVANAIGNRPYPALFPVFYALFNLVGAEEAYGYINGLQSWDTPEVRQVLEWSVRLRENGFWPETFATMTIDEFHVYFHTQKKAAMLCIPSWYTGRAFKPVDQGGQSPDFHFGMLRYPTMDGAKAPDRIIGGFESGYMISAATEHPDVARDILAFLAQPKYGALWEASTNIPTCIKYTPEDEPADLPENKMAWYTQEIKKVYGPLPMDVVELLAPPERSGDFKDATTSVLNEGLPLGLITVDEAIEMLNEAVKK
jgi:ABC-type glycerol-3-phosphate transport system substrate-binding protein